MSDRDWYQCGCLMVEGQPKEECDTHRKLRVQLVQGEQSFEQFRRVFVQLRQAVRDLLARGFDIRSNPGWSDEDVLHGVAQALADVQALRAQLAQHRLSASDAKDVERWRRASRGSRIELNPVGILVDIIDRLILADLLVVLLFVAWGCTSTPPPHHRADPVPVKTYVAAHPNPSAPMPVATPVVEDAGGWDSTIKALGLKQMWWLLFGSKEEQP